MTEQPKSFLATINDPIIFMCYPIKSVHVILINRQVLYQIKSTIFSPLCFNLSGVIAWLTIQFSRNFYCYCFLKTNNQSGMYNWSTIQFSCNSHWAYSLYIVTDQESINSKLPSSLGIVYDSIPFLL